MILALIGSMKENSIINMRDKAILSIFYCSGISIRDFMDLCLDDIHSNGQRLFISSEKSFRYDIMLCAPILITCINDWINYLKSIDYPGDNKLFPIFEYNPQTSNNNLINRTCDPYKVISTRASIAMLPHMTPFKVKKAGVCHALKLTRSTQEIMAVVKNANIGWATVESFYDLHNPIKQSEIISQINFSEKVNNEN